MLREYHELDPHGDVELVLETHSYPHETPDDLLPLAERDDSRSDLAPPPESEGAPAEPVEASGHKRTASAGSSAPRGGREPDLKKPENANTSISSRLAWRRGSTGRIAVNISSGEIRMRVSSKHLSLAASHFERMFHGDWGEGNTLRSIGAVEIPLKEDDPAALLILMNIIHGRTRKVPRQVDLKTLTQLAILVDYYHFHEAVEVFSDMWVDGLKERLPQTYTTDLVRWICISWVFQKPHEFRKVTRIAQRQTKSVIAEDWLPIPDSIVGQYSLPLLIHGLTQNSRDD